MEKLRVENFLVIKKAELNPSRFCVIIGPQASGKSVLAKLVHLFRTFFDESTRKVLLDKKGEQSGNLGEAMAGVLKKSFSEYFPGIRRKGHSFLIEYSSEDFSAVIRGGFGALDNGEIEVQLSDGYVGFLETSIREFGEFKQSPRASQLEASHDREYLYVFLKASQYAHPFRIATKNSVFVPASRAYIASLQKHIFSVVRSGVILDSLITDFGSRYEFSKEVFEQDTAEFLETAKPLFRSILAGAPLFSEGEDWIENDQGRVKLQHASSGQQEALPMLVVLSVWAGVLSEGSGFIIEEPEAHLYPRAQKDIMSLLGLISNEYNLDFLITTHSPYILAALNNLILAGEAREAVGDDELRKVINPEFTLRFSDVSAYTLVDGELRSILDQDEKLIGINAIDGVSDEFSSEFEALLELRATGGRGAYSG